MLVCDLHIHTVNSRCCSDPEQTVERVAARLAARGFRRIGFTDHFWRHPTVPPSPFYQAQDGRAILELKARVRELALPLEVLVGGEADMVAPGVFGVDAAFREQLDYLLLSSDHFQNRGFVQPPAEVSPRGIARQLVEFFRSAARSGLADILSHPFYPYSYTEFYDEAVALLSDSQLLDLFGEAAAHQVALEINRCVIPDPARGSVFSPETPQRLFTLAREAGCRFTLGSDAHRASDFAIYPQLEAFMASVGIGEPQFAPLMRVPAPAAG